MKLEEILAEWDKDAMIDKTDLGNESIRIPQLHNKYYRIYIQEKLILTKYKEEHKRLKLDKHEFYFMGPTPETEEKGWKLPPQGKILKADLNNYIDADDDIIKRNLKIGIQYEKVEMLKSIIDSFKNRGFLVKQALDWEKFQVGAF